MRRGSWGVGGAMLGGRPCMHDGAPSIDKDHEHPPLPGGDWVSGVADAAGVAHGAPLLQLQRGGSERLHLAVSSKSSVSKQVSKQRKECAADGEVAAVASSGMRRRCRAAKLHTHSLTAYLRVHLLAYSPRSVCRRLQRHSERRAQRCRRAASHHGAAAGLGVQT